MENSDQPKSSRPVKSVVDAVRTLEGAGFPVRRPFQPADARDKDPFLLLDHLGPTEWGPGEAIGAPDHPHRGFETISYNLSGRKEHKDSVGHISELGPGDVQWMTAGAGVIHSEMPHPEFQAGGGMSHAFQIWVNLPAKDKMMAPRYQTVPKEKIPAAFSDDKRVEVRVVAGTALGVSAVIETRTPVMYLHYLLKPGGKTVQAMPQEYNAMAYVFSGAAELGPEPTPTAEGQLALFGPGEEIQLGVPDDATEGAELLLLAGVPIEEPIAWYGPFVMNTEAEIQQAVEDFNNGKFGKIEG